MALRPPFYLSLITLISLAVDPSSLYLYLEGVKLVRHDSISIISLYVLPRKKIYLVDIHRLGKTAFSTTNSSTTSLKTILESPTIPKAIFDIRNDSDALFSHYEIFVDGIKDLQLMELATRKDSKDFVAGLAKCIEKDSPVSTAVKVEWQRTKEGASRLYDPKKGGRYEIFNERPMRSEIVHLYGTKSLAIGYSAGKTIMDAVIKELLASDLDRNDPDHFQASSDAAFADDTKTRRSSEG